MPAAMAMSKQGVLTGKTRHRSPGYPRLGLSKALEYARKFYNAEAQSFVAPIVAITHFGFMAAGSNKDQMSGHASCALSALKHFALLEERDGDVGLTGRSLDILLAPNDDPARRKALREAVMSPAIYRELWDMYKGKLPSDEALGTIWRGTVSFIRRTSLISSGNFKASLDFAVMTWDAEPEASTASLFRGSITGIPVAGVTDKELKSTGLVIPRVSLWKEPAEGIKNTCTRLMRVGPF